MNATTRAVLDGTPIPFEDGQPVEACVVESDGWRTAWAYDGGRRKEPFGDPFSSARDAARAARRLNERGASV